MTHLITTHASIPAMSEQSVSKARSLEAVLKDAPQQEIETKHIIHGGVYSRTIMVPAGVVITGALIKVPTQLIISGSVKIYADEVLSLTGYNVLTGSVGRKCVFVAETDVWMTMVFRTDVKTVEEAEQEFTDEWEMLGSLRNLNSVLITGE